MEIPARVVSRLNNTQHQRALRVLRQNGALIVGRHTYGLPEIFVSHPEDQVSIGSYCSIGPHVRLIPGGIHPSDTVSTFPFLRRWGLESTDSSVDRVGPIRIGHDVWIGTGATVLSGVSIGTGAIVAAGALVNSDVAPYSVVGGVPARPLRHRFDAETCQALLTSEWWERPQAQLEHLLPLLTQAEPSRFLEALGRL